MRPVIRALVGLAAGLVLLFGMAASALAACEPGATLVYVCGLVAPEDLVAVPDSRFLVASSLRQGSGADARGGGLVLIDTRSLAAAKAEILSGPPRAPFAACPGPPDLAHFSSHGLNLRRDGRGRGTLFAVSHGAREAIEVFDVRARSGPPTLTWIGCVRAPDGAYNNAAVGLKDGRIIVTDFMHAPATAANVLRGEVTGSVLLWTPGGTFRELPGTALSGPNGVEVTPDSRWLFVASTGQSAVLRYDLKHIEAAPAVIRPGLRADNLRWSPDGRLLLAGPGTGRCTPPERPCNRSVVAALDPVTLRVTTVLDIPAEQSFPGLSAAVRVGDNLWLGSYQADRVGRATVKR